MSIKNKRILIAVTGGIAAYKVNSLIRDFIKKEAEELKSSNDNPIQDQPKVENESFGLFFKPKNWISWTAAAPTRKDVR